MNKKTHTTEDAVAAAPEPESKFLSVGQILAEDKREIEILDVPEWGGKIRLGPISAAERDELDQLSMRFLPDGSRETRIQTKRCMLVAMCLVDEHGKRLLDDKQIRTFGKGKDPKTIDRLFKICQQINGLETGAAEEAEKN